MEPEPADPSIDWSKHAWFEGKIGLNFAFSTSKELLSSVGARDIVAAVLVKHEGVMFPSGGQSPNDVLLDFFLP